MVQRVKLPAVRPASHMGAQVQILVAGLQIQLPANAPKKAEDGPSISASNN